MLVNFTVLEVYQHCPGKTTLCRNYSRSEDSSVVETLTVILELEDKTSIKHTVSVSLHLSFPTANPRQKFIPEIYVKCIIAIMHRSVSRGSIRNNIQKIICECEIHQKQT